MPRSNRIGFVVVIVVVIVVTVVTLTYSAAHSLWYVGPDRRRLVAHRSAAAAAAAFAIEPPPRPSVIVWDASVPGRFFFGAAAVGGGGGGATDGSAGERPVRWRSVDGSDWLSVEPSPRNNAAADDGPVLESSFGDTVPLVALRGGGGGMTTAYDGYTSNHAAYALVFGPARRTAGADTTTTTTTTPTPTPPLLSRRSAAGDAAGEAWAGPFDGVFYGWGTGDNAPLGSLPDGWSSPSPGSAGRRVAILSVDGPAVRARWSGDGADAVREYAVAPDRYDQGRFALRVLRDPALTLYELQIHRRPLDRAETDALFRRLTTKWGVAIPPPPAPAATRTA